MPQAIDARAPETANSCPSFMSTCRAASSVFWPESAARIASSGKRSPKERTTRSGFSGTPGFCSASCIIAPATHTRPRAVDERAIRLAAHAVVQQLERGLRVAHEAGVHGVSEANALRIEVDLHALGLLWLRVVLDVGERRAHDQQRVALLQRFL